MRKIVIKINGFSLMELMAALTVAALLIGVAVPSYIHYQSRAKMIEVIQVLQSHLDEAKKQYVSSATIPSSVSGIASGAFTAYTNSSYISEIYYDDGATWTNAGKGAMVQAIVTNAVGNGISGYTAGEAGTNNRVTVAFLADGEILQQFCGSWVNDGTEVPLDYLPAGCQNSGFAATVTGN